MRVQALWFVALSMWMGCIQTPENGASVYESQEIQFDGYALEGNVDLQYEVVTGYHADPNCPPTQCECSEEGGERVCSCGVPDCAAIPEYGWKSFAGTHTGTSRYNLFDDLQETMYSWEKKARLPADAFRQVKGRDGRWFRGARVRAVLNGNQYFYTVKPGSMACWQANRSKYQQWIRTCTPETSNTVLELRSAGR